MTSSKPVLSVSRPNSWVLPHIQTSLRLLGFGGHEYKHLKERVLTDSKLFQHSDHDAFQQVGWFLLHSLDAKCCAMHMRDAWPVLERRQHAEFRKQFAVCYKELQTEHKGLLPMLNASLLQTPGGPKFVNFLLAFVNFVMQTLMKRDKVVVQMMDAQGEAKLAMNRLCEVTTDNLERANTEKAAGEEAIVELKNLTQNEILPIYEEVRNQLESLTMPENLEALRNETNLLKGGGLELISRTEQLEFRMQDLSKNIRDMHESFSSARNAVDLTKWSHKKYNFVHILKQLVQEDSELIQLLQRPHELMQSLPSIATSANTFRVAAQSFQDHHQSFYVRLESLNKEVLSVQKPTHLVDSEAHYGDLFKSCLPKWKPRPLAQINGNRSGSKPSEEAKVRWAIHMDTIVHGLVPLLKKDDEDNEIINNRDGNIISRCHETLEEIQVLSGHQGPSYGSAIAGRPTPPSSAFEMSKMSNFEPIMSSSHVVSESNTTIKSSNPNTTAAFSPLRRDLTMLSNDTGLVSQSPSTRGPQETSSPLENNWTPSGPFSSMDSPLHSDLVVADPGPPVANNGGYETEKRAPIRLSDVFLHKSNSSTTSVNEPVTSVTSEELWTRLDSLAITLAEDSDDVFLQDLDEKLKTQDS